MSEHKALIEWTVRGNFLDGEYSREHTWKFDGGLAVPASPSPTVVRVPFSNPECVDPEEAFVAAIASCHMLTFLYLASRAGIEVLSYQDSAVGTMTKNEKRVPWISSVTLNPIIEYAEGAAPSLEREDGLHQRAHEGCFISNSVKTEIIVKTSRRN